MKRRFTRVRTYFFSLIVAGAVCAVSLAAQRGQPAPAATGTGLIAGRVVDADTGQPIAGATVVLRGSSASGGPSPVITDSQGRFFFGRLPAGAYLTMPQREGFTGLPPFSPIPLSDGERVTDARLRLRRFSTISGTARDDAGDPIVDTEILALRRTSVRGLPVRLTPAARDRTDDRGTYRLSNLPVGEYYICACSREPIPFDGQLLTTLAARPLDLLGVALRAAKVGADAASLDDTLRTYAPTFYPNTPLASRATRVALAPGEAKQAIDIDMTAVRAARVTGMIIGATGPSVAASSVRLVPTGDVPEASALTQFVPMLLQPDGRFDFAGIPPGQYTLEVISNEGSRIGGPSGAALAFLGARGRALAAPIPPVRVESSSTAPPPERLWSVQPLSVGGDDVTGLVVGLQPGFTISGRMEFRGTTAPPVGRELSRLGAALQPLERFSSNSRVNLNADGTFTLTGVIPGRYSIIPVAQGPPWTDLRSITIGGVDVTDTLVNVDADLTDVVMTLSDETMATVLGTVAFAVRDESEDTFVRLFPTDRRYWAEPFGAFRRFRTVRVTDAGTYTIPRVPAGEYYIVAAPDGTWEWMDSRQLEALAKGATRTTVANGDNKSVEIRR